MKLDTAPITVATTALTIPAIAPWEAGGGGGGKVCLHFSELKAMSNLYRLKVNPVNTSKNQ